MAPGVVLIFDPTTPPERLRIFVGLDPSIEDESPDLWPGPQNVSVRSAERCDGPMPLGVDHGWAELSLDDAHRRSGRLELVFHDRLRGGDPTVYPLLVVAEIELLR